MEVLIGIGDGDDIAALGCLGHHRHRNQKPPVGGDGVPGHDALQRRSLDGCPRPVDVQHVVVGQFNDENSAIALTAQQTFGHQTLHGFAQRPARYRELRCQRRLTQLRAGRQHTTHDRDPQPLGDQLRGRLPLQGGKLLRYQCRHVVS